MCAGGPLIGDHTRQQRASPTTRREKTTFISSIHVINHHFHHHQVHQIEPFPFPSSSSDEPFPLTLTPVQAPSKMQASGKHHIYKTITQTTASIAVMIVASLQYRAQHCHKICKKKQRKTSHRLLNVTLSHIIPCPRRPNLSYQW